MDEFTDEQLDLVAKAFNNLCLKHERATSEDLVAELRKKPVTFADGQVVLNGATLDRYHLYDKLGCDSDCRPLNQREVGPDYVPRAEFEKVESALEVAFRGVEDISDSNDVDWSQGRATAVLKKIREIMEIPQ